MAAGLDDVLMNYLPTIATRSKWVYWLLLIGLCLAIAWTPFITLDVIVRARGVVRPEQERIELKPVTSSVIDKVYYRDGDLVPKDSPILRLYNMHAAAKAAQIRFELDQRAKAMQDLQWLIRNVEQQEFVDSGARFRSEMWQREWALFQNQLRERSIGLHVLRKEVDELEQLCRLRLVARKQFEDKRATYEQSEAAYRAFLNGKVQEWQQQLDRFRSESEQFHWQWQQLVYDRQMYEIRAPITGRILGLNRAYSGSTIQAGEVVGELTPETCMIAEIIVPARDIGLVFEGQRVYYQIEAFDYRYFGKLHGRILRIAQDFTVNDGQLCFKVHANFDSTILRLSNGYTASLKKGMTFQAGFLVARRSLWHLLYDKIEDWLNPSTVQ